ncbi:hypothetical protein niasHT_036977 [Heterodera trifolii]|uniref:Peptidase M41 domain-containing protein n=1 Tax=Heterodera trifolii TaxID=157864 RepID=A0ABD2ICU2_9BILA
MRKENSKNSAASTDSDANAKSGGDVSPTAPTEEEAEEISANEQQKEQRKPLDALYAAAREEFDLDMSPLDSAMKTLREGREIQKLSVLRNLMQKSPCCCRCCAIWTLHANRTQPMPPSSRRRHKNKCFVAVFGEETDVFSGRLLPILEQFYRDSDDEVRSIIASGFHEIVAQHKIAPMGSKNAKNSSSISASVPLLLGPFVDLLSSGNADIVQQLTANLHRILQILYAEISASGTKNRTHLIFAKLDRILVNCNNLMKGSGSWRAHEAYLNGIAVLRNLVSTKDLLSNFVSLLKQEVLTARALPCRIAAAQTLLLMMREFATSRARQNIVKFFVHEIGHHSSCYRRRLLLHTELSLLQYFSREIFIDKFLPAVLKLYADQISNIRTHFHDKSSNRWANRFCTILHFDELIIRASFHESGHTLLLYLLKDADQHIRTVLIRRPVFTFGMTVAKPRENYSQKQLVARLQMQFGGTVAESLKFGNVVLDNHDKSDRLYCGSISRCTSVSGNMVILLVSNEINSTGCCTLLLPCIIQLCKDEDPSVREAILSSMALCLPHFSKDAKKPVLLPLLRNLDFACQQNATNATQQQTTAQKQGDNSKRIA